MHTIEKHQLGLSLIKKGIGVADWIIPTHLDMNSQPIPEYQEDRAKIKYKSHKIGTFLLKECAQFVNKYFGVDKGGSAWSHNYTVPFINGYEGIKKTNRHGNRYENHFSYNLDAADNFKKIFKEDMLDPKKASEVQSVSDPSSSGMRVNEYNFGVGTPDIKSLWNTGDYKPGGSPFAYIESLRDSYYG